MGGAFSWADGMIASQYVCIGRRDSPVILTASFGRLLGPVGTFSILRRMSMLSPPSTIFPKQTCLPSRNSAGAVVMKNWRGVKEGREGGNGDQRRVMVEVSHETSGHDRAAHALTWQPLVCGPELAMERTGLKVEARVSGTRDNKQEQEVTGAQPSTPHSLPGPVCLTMKFSSSNGPFC